jgi:CBS domain-containing protein
VMGVLTNKRVRHLPVLSDGALVGMISIGDVVKLQYDEVVSENHMLRNYIDS